VLKTVLQKISQMKQPVKFLLKSSGNPWANGCMFRLFFDLTKACDVISHEILLAKLEYYGIREIIKAWVESYLSYRSQCLNS